MTIALRYAAYSDVGCLREGNEDSGYAGQHLLAVADGMGGYAGGEVASSIAISSIRSLDTSDDPRAEEMAEVLQRAVEKANESLAVRIRQEPQLENMGTTLTAMLWSGSQVALIHIGDSRAYLMRGSRFEQITHDHTLVQTLVDEGKITEEEVATHPQRSLILRALDGKTPVDPDISISRAKAGDRYLLCSDGLSGVVSKKTIHETLATEHDPRTAAKKLIELAIRGGGPDNITAVVADVIETDTDHDGPTAGAQTVGAADQRDVSTGPNETSPARRAQELRGNGGDTAEMDPIDGQSPPPAGAYGSPSYEEQPYDDYDAPTSRGQNQESEYRTRSWWPIVLVFVIVVGAIAGGGYYFGRQYIENQYFVGVSADGSTVSVYRGIDTNIAGFDLSDEVESTDLSVESLAPTDQQDLRTNIEVDSLDAAQTVIEDLREQAETSDRTQNGASGQGTETEESG
ncbi:Stp1/IreP family PP2C-type Ser/Thr phosphatase [Nocardiopsis sp. MG754419]|uniref:Stp1/IreP family PP2C-type Ser/Thr phosphatase n=1 Tax=Nocardiopsis sp. MG754419 TaxID=2259865 RepID=UPI001BA67A20|nr:Stp1/IreP family PP2C-type Ser/Thr phosphatase [Nocardiopsis sp. MG754419]MBR8742262.1 Stp1/IreP family PP2C-type Ser/Thr phosphatase [Nocardiopsis sp. MG754419]